MKSPQQACGARLEKTLATERHKALIALLIRKREMAGLSQAALAQQLGEYQSFVARLESGQRRLDVVEFLRLAEVLDFEPARAIASLKKVR